VRSVTINAEPCIDVTLLTVVTNTNPAAITCRIPEGAGRSLNVIVVVSGISSSSNPALKFAYDGVHGQAVQSDFDHVQHI